MIAPQKREIILREPRHSTELRRSLIPFYITSIIQAALVLILLVLIYFISLVFFRSFIEINMIIVSFVATAIVIVSILSFGFLFLDQRSVSFRLVPGYVQRTENQIVDQIPGKVLVNQGFLYRSKTLLTMRDYDHVKVEKSFLGRIFHYGDIYLEKRGELGSAERYVLKNVVEPEAGANLIQHMMDLELSQSTLTRNRNGNFGQDAY